MDFKIKLEDFLIQKNSERKIKLKKLKKGKELLRVVVD